MHYGRKKKKLKVELPCGPAIPFLGIYLDTNYNRIKDFKIKKERNVQPIPRRGIAES